MKSRMTRNQIKNLFAHVYCVGYCGLQHCGIDAFDAIGYGAGTYGWNYDVIPVGNSSCIVTGYRPFGAELPFTDDERRRFDELRKVCYADDMTPAGIVRRKNAARESREMVLGAIARAESGNV